MLVDILDDSYTVKCCEKIHQLTTDLHLFQNSYFLTEQYMSSKEICFYLTPDWLEKNV